MGVKLMKTYMRRQFIDNGLAYSSGNIVDVRGPNKSVVEVNAPDLHDSVIAIDAWNFIHRCFYSMDHSSRQIHKDSEFIAPVMPGTHDSTRSLAETFFGQIISFIDCDIYPIFVFDQDQKAMRYEPLLSQTSKNKQLFLRHPPLGMGHVRHHFTKADETHMKICKGILDAIGLLHFTSRTPAENTCKLLVDRQIAFAVLTEDTDIFAMGCRQVLTYSNRRSGYYFLWNQKGILNELGITQKQLSHACVLMGTDDCAGVSFVDARISMTLTDAVECIREHGDIHGFLVHAESCDLYVICDKAAMLMAVERYINPAVVMFQQDMDNMVENICIERQQQQQQQKGLSIQTSLRLWWPMAESR